MPASLIRSRTMITRALDRHRWEEIADGAVLQEDGVISAEQKEQALAAAPKVIAFARPRRDTGFQFVDFLAREARLDGIESLTAQSYTVHSTINAQLQRDTEAALQEGLAQYEMSRGAKPLG